VSIQWIDLSISLDEDTLPFPGDEPLKLEWKASIKKDGYRLSRLSTNMHLGTHIDFPSHGLNRPFNFETTDMVRNGNCIFVNPKEGCIRTKDIQMAYQMIDKPEHVLIIATGHERHLHTRQYFEYPKFEQSIFSFLQEHKIHILGADLPSFEYVNEAGFSMHNDCFNQDMCLVENLVNLNRLSSWFEWIILPLPIEGIEASLIRPIARNL